VASGGLLVGVVLGCGTGCSEQTFTQITVLDMFQQNRTNAVDLLVVIDNSCSMIEEQENLATNFEELITTFTEAETDWQVGVTTTDVESERFRGLLMAGEDEIIMRGPSGELDRVEYDREWPFSAGTSLQLSAAKYNWVSNDALANWCLSGEEFSEGSIGSPGLRNTVCDGSEDVPPEVGDDEGPRAPKTGDLIITEIMAWSVDLDARCEWFELTNLTDDTLSLDDVQFSDRGNNYAAVEAGQSVAPHGTYVVGRNAVSAENCETPVDLAVPTGFTLNHDVRVLSPSTLGANEIFQENVAQGTEGAGIELGLEASRLVFEEPYYTEQNQSWLRDHAALAVMFVSDEDDVSPYSVDAYLRYFRGLKPDGYRDLAKVRVSAVVGKEPTTSHLDPSCVSEDGSAYYARRYIELAARTDGLVESICEDDFAPVVRELGLTLTGLELKFVLSDLPKLETLVVNLYADEEEDSLVKELIRDQDFEYVAEGNFLLFSESQVPPSEYYVVATYDPLPEGARQEDEGS